MILEDKLKCCSAIPTPRRAWKEQLDPVPSGLSPGQRETGPPPGAVTPLLSRDPSHRDRLSPSRCKVGPMGSAHGLWSRVDAASAPAAHPGHAPAMLQIILPPALPGRGLPGVGTIFSLAAFSLAPFPTVLNLGFFSLKSRDVIGTSLYHMDSLFVELRGTLLQKRLFAP